MTVQFAVELPVMRVDQPDQFVTAEAIADVARAASAAGFSAVYVTDHPAPDAKWLDHGGHHASDPFVALAFAAAADPQIRLLTNIYVAAYRNPFLGAKLVQSLDVLSGGRLVLGVAAGYLKAEFFALGVEFEQRGKLLDDALAVLDAVYTGDDVAWQSSVSNARGVRLRPIPPTGRPPVWVGGNSKAAMARAVRFDGWNPFNSGGIATTARTASLSSDEELAEAIVYVRSLLPADRADRFDICWSGGSVASPQLSVDERCSRVAALAGAGVTWLTVSMQGADRSELLDAMAEFGADVIAGVGQA